MSRRKPPKATGADCTKVDESVRGLQKALKQLNHEQARVGRGNARRAVLGELRRLRDAVDEAFPPIAPKRAPKKRKTPAQRMRALKKDGWVNVDFVPGLHVADDIKAACIKHGIRAKALPGGHPTGAASMWVPGWVVAAVKAGATDTEIRAAKRSPQKRRALEAVATLKELAPLARSGLEPKTILVRDERGRTKRIPFEEFSEEFSPLG